MNPHVEGVCRGFTPEKGRKKCNTPTGGFALKCDFFLVILQQDKALRAFKMNSDEDETIMSIYASAAPDGVRTR